MNEKGFVRPSFARQDLGGFTLIELLVVIAVIAVLAVVVVLTLNPAGLLQESRDSNRLSDMATISSALGISLADNPSASLGSSSVLYVSIPDPSATSTLGDQCQGLGLPALPAGWAYQCAASGTFRKTDGSGWIPVNFSQNTFGTSLAQLPLDPVNATSSGLYYTYATNGAQYEVASLFESQKYKAQFAQNPIVPGYPEVNAKGSSLSLNPLWSPQGLVGYWPMDEGTGSTTLDLSGNGNGGTWNGTPAGTSGYYSAGKVGSFAGNFNGSDDSVSIANTSSKVFPATGSPFTLAEWVYASSLPGSSILSLIDFDNYLVSGFRFGLCTAGNPYACPAGSLYFWSNEDGGSLSFQSSILLSSTQWYHVAMVYSGSNATFYVNAKPAGSAAGTIVIPTNSFFLAKPFSYGAWPGLIDDVRVYNRALSAAEIQSLYNAEK